VGPWRINSSLIIKDFFPLGVECQKSQPIGEKPCLFSCTVFADTLRKCKKPVGVSEKQSTGRCGMQVFRNAYDYFFNPHEMRQLPNQVPASITGIKNLLRKDKKFIKKKKEHPALCCAITFRPGCSWGFSYFRNTPALKH